MLEPILYEVRENYTRHPMLINVDTFKQPGSGRYKVEAHYLTADPLDDAYIKSNDAWTVDTDGSFTRDGTTTIEHDAVMVQKYSPSGKYKATLKMTAEGALIEIFKNGILWYRKPVPATTHLTPVKSSVFMTELMIFSEDETRFMYMADDPEPMVNVYKLKEQGLKKHKYKDSLGERLSTHHHPSIFIFDLKEKQIIKVEKPQETSQSRVIYLQPQFADKSGNSIICVSLNMVGATEQLCFMNYKKGLVFIKDLEMSKSVEGLLGLKLWLSKPITFESREGIQEEVAFFPRMSPDFKQVSYFFNLKCPLPALSICGLRVMDIETYKTETIVDEQEEDGVEFAGIDGFHISLCKYAWINNENIVVSSAHHQTFHMYEINVPTKTVTKINKTPKYLKSEATFFLAKLDDDLILAKRDCLYRNYMLFALKRNSDGSYTEIGGMEFEEEDKEFEYFEETLEINGIEATFYGQITDEAPMKERPLVLHLHGGPHAISMNIRHPLLHLIAKNGGTVLNINYTGSSGRGAKFSRDLCGRSLDIEVEEVKTFIDKLIKEENCDPAQIKVFTGSYGGYITLGLLNKYPDLISQASIFNPVVNAFSMNVGSNANKYIYSTMLGETEGDFQYNRHLTDAECLTLMQKSPVFSDYKFKAQVVFFTGLKDDVVPPLSTRSLFKRLRALGLQVQLYEYPNEEHLIMMVGPNFDFSVKTAILFAGLLPF